MEFDFSNEEFNYEVKWKILKFYYCFRNSRKQIER
jgi:hypothetical protein